MDPLRAPSTPVPLDRRLVAPTRRRPEEARADRLDEGVWCLRLPLPYRNTRVVNCLLLEHGEGWTLVDCGSGLGVGWAALVHALGLAGVAPGAIGALVLTHLHADHASLAGEVVDRLGCRVLRLAGPESGVDRLREPTIALETRRAAARAEGVPDVDLEDIVDAPLAGDGLQVRPRPDRLLVEGDTLQMGGGTWTVVPAPGHSPQQMMLFDPVRRWLIAADAAYPGIRPYLEWGYTPDPVSEYVDTLARVDALAPALFIPGHGRPDTDPRERVASARAAIASTTARVVAEVGPEPRTPYEIACRVSGDDANPDARGSWLSVCLSVLDHLEARGDVGSRTGSDGVRRLWLSPR